jgi:hypothetical protein
LPSRRNSRPFTRRVQECFHFRIKAIMCTLRTLSFHSTSVALLGLSRQLQSRWRTAFQKLLSVSQVSSNFTLQLIVFGIIGTHRVLTSISLIYSVSYLPHRLPALSHLTCTLWNPSGLEKFLARHGHKLGELGLRDMNDLNVFDMCPAITLLKVGPLLQVCLFPSVICPSYS